MAKKAAVIICTDGEATDGDVAAALKPLEDLPVWVVLRLCTDEKEVLSYWESVDKVLELEVDVLDDWFRDAEKIYHSNPWLNYGDCLHHLREFGTVFKELDIINESKLTSEQMRAVVATIYAGGAVKEVPHPDIDWGAFAAYVRKMNNSTPAIFNCLNNKYEHWINLEKLGSSYGNGQFTSQTCCIQ